MVYGETGAWMNNFFTYPAMILAPLLGLPVPQARCCWRARCQPLAFLCSSLANAGIILTAGFSLFPFLMPSSTNPNMSLTMWDATSSELTLGIMTFVAAVFVPIILCYTLWCFYKMWGTCGREAHRNQQQFPVRIRGVITMWYFAWILGVLLACSFGIINVRM